MKGGTPYTWIVQFQKCATMKGPERVLSVQGTLYIFNFLWPDPIENDYWPYLCILCNKNGIWDSREIKWDHHWVQDPPWSFNGSCHGPTIHQTWPFIYWLYFCILCNKKVIKGLWGHKRPSPLGLGPALVHQWILPWPYNTPHIESVVSSFLLFQ